MKKTFILSAILAMCFSSASLAADSTAHPAHPLAVPANLIPSVPSAKASTLEPPSYLLHLREQANFAKQAQQMENEISLLKLEKEVSALKKSIRKNAPASEKLDAPGQLASAADNYVTTIVGFHGQWRADMYLDGHGYWIKPGDHTSMGTVASISGAGVWLQTPHGKVLIGMKGQQEKTGISSLPSMGSSATAQLGFSNFPNGQPSAVRSLPKPKLPVPSMRRG